MARSRPPPPAPAIADETPALAAPPHTLADRHPPRPRVFAEFGDDTARPADGEWRPNARRSAARGHNRVPCRIPRETRAVLAVTPCDRRRGFACTCTRADIPATSRA